MNKRQAKKIYYNFRTRINGGPGHRFDTIQRAWAKQLSVLSRHHGVKTGFRMFAGTDEMHAHVRSWA